MRTAFASLILGCLAVAACGRGSPTQTNDANGAAGTRPHVGMEACAASQTFNGVKRRLFENVRAVPGANSVAIGQLEQGSILRIMEPVLDQQDTDTGRTICSGRLVLDLPPNLERSFGPDRQLSLQIRYSAQQAADGSGLVYEVFGAESLVQRIAQGTSGRSQASVVPAPAGPDPIGAQTNFNPSFRCTATNTFVERMTCSSPELSAMDRRSTAAYNRALEYADEPGARASIRQFQRGFLRDLSTCRTRFCVARAYQAQISRLEMMGGE